MDSDDKIFHVKFLVPDKNKVNKNENIIYAIKTEHVNIFIAVRELGINESIQLSLNNLSS